MSYDSSALMRALYVTKKQWFFSSVRSSESTVAMNYVALRWWALLVIIWHDFLAPICSLCVTVHYDLSATIGLLYDTMPLWSVGSDRSSSHYHISFTIWSVNSHSKIVCNDQLCLTMLIHCTHISASPHRESWAFFSAGSRILLHEWQTCHVVHSEPNLNDGKT